MTFILGFYLGGVLVAAAPWLQPPLNRGWFGSAALCGLTWPVWLVRMFFNNWRDRNDDD
jgi:hypothetical protein